MKYEFAPDLQYEAEKISKLLFPHVKIEFIKCLRSSGSSSRRTIARCHALGKLMQKAMQVPAFYAIEFLTEQFEKLDKEEQTKVIIHELMHIPYTFGGGFKHHDHVTRGNVEKMYKQYIALKKENEYRSLEIERYGERLKEKAKECEGEKNESKSKSWW